ncbi:MAG: ABC transporter permease [Halanaerobiaceae bacterium]
MNYIREQLKRVNKLRQYPSAIIGLSIISILILISVITVIFIPYEKAVMLWRGGQVWQETPRNARPIWTDWFSSEKLPRTKIIESRELEGMQIVEEMDGGASRFEIELPFNYDYDGFPKEVNLFLESEFEDNRPFGSVTWITPDGREYKSREMSFDSSSNFRFGRDKNIKKAFPDQDPEKGLFSDPDAEEQIPLKGEYKIRISGYIFEENSRIEARNVLYGQVHGLAGTDHRRRELLISLLWGTPVALLFGVLAAIGTTITTLIIAAIGVWYGGWIDALIQRITEINLILPLLPILVMVGMFLSRSLWTMLAVVILLGIFSAGVKTYRAMFLQIKGAPFIEAARAYGASNFRIIFFYLIPKIIPTLIPSFITAIPTYIFLEASLAMLGLGDPVLPTWGKVLNDAHANGALFMGDFYWILQPAVLLMMTGLGFAMTGFALDRIFNPRLRRL